MLRDDALKVFHQTGALLEGHFRLTSGLHSPQYFQCAKVLQHPLQLERIAADIITQLHDGGLIKDFISVVISPAIGGIIIGQEIARILQCHAIFAEREKGLMTLRRGFEIKPGELVIAVEDVVTTGGSIQEVISLAKKAGGVVIGAGFVVDRSAGKVAFDVPHFSVLQMEVITYQPGNCPLCKQGIPLVKPGSRNV